MRGSETGHESGQREEVTNVLQRSQIRTDELKKGRHTQAGQRLRGHKTGPDREGKEATIEGPKNCVSNRTEIGTEHAQAEHERTQDGPDREGKEAKNEGPSAKTGPMNLNYNGTCQIEMTENENTRVRKRS
jgi:hypothetical protein